jgi:hypothetical protein
VTGSSLFKLPLLYKAESSLSVKKNVVRIKVECLKYLDVLPNGHNYSRLQESPNTAEVMTTDSESSVAFSVRIDTQFVHKHYICK